MTGKPQRRRPVVAAVVMVAVLAAALCIMISGAGLQDSLDFGAGAYYYADIPEFDKYVKDQAFHTDIPYIVYVLLFLGWGALMYLLWCWIEKRK